MKLKALCLFSAIALSSTLMAQEKISIATGGKKGTYYPMIEELSQACSSSLSITNVETSGCEQNLNMLLGNKVNAVMCQADSLFSQHAQQPIHNVKTLVAMHPEEIHLVSKILGRREGGFFGIGGANVKLQTVEDLAGRTVGAAGGSFRTAQIVKAKTRISFEIERFENNSQLMESLVNGKIHAAFLVGGAPMKVIEDMDNSYKLLSFPSEVQKQLAEVYTPARLNYPNLGNSVETIATEAVLVTREYRSQEMLTALSSFRGCANRAIDRLKDMTNTHPKWQSVNVGYKGKWLWYDLPDSKSSAPDMTNVKPSQEALEAANRAVEAAKIKK